MKFEEYNEDLFSCPDGTYFVQCASADLTLGAGIAVQFNEWFDIKNKLRKKYPEGIYDRLYGERCWKVACIFEYPVFTLITKEHYYDKPTLKTMEVALKMLKEQMESLGIHHIAMPQIGCGLDRLPWGKVKTRIINTFRETDVCIEVYSTNTKAFEKTVVEVFPTHMEVRPYTKGSNFEMEKQLSTWNDVRRRYQPFGYDCVEDTLLLPRGTSEYNLKEWFPNSVCMKSTDMVCPKTFQKYEMTISLRDEIQEDIVQYLMHEGPYQHQAQNRQFTLEAQTGTGKTVCMIYALLQKRIRTIIISHQNRIQKQWIDTFRYKTTMDMGRICYVDDCQIFDLAIRSQNYADIYITTHQMIYSYVQRLGWNRFNQFLERTGIGIKVIDEAHLFFENIIRIDTHVNIPENFYLSATLARSSARENRIMKLVFGNAIRFLANTREQRKHIVYTMVLYNSHPSQMVLAKLQNRYGFSATRFIQYAVFQDPNKTILEAMRQQFEKTLQTDGRTLIVSPTIDSSNYIADLLQTQYPRKSAGAVNSSIPVDERESRLQNTEVISSTIKSSGTGVDIPKLRFLHCLEPHTSIFITKQLAGRLREYSATEFTYMFDYFDLGVPQMYSMMQRHRKAMEELAAKIEVIEL